MEVPDHEQAHRSPEVRMHFAPMVAGVLRLLQLPGASASLLLVSCIELLRICVQILAGYSGKASPPPRRGGRSSPGVHTMRTTLLPTVLSSRSLTRARCACR